MQGGVKCQGFSGTCAVGGGFAHIGYRGQLSCVADYRGRLSWPTIVANYRGQLRSALRRPIHQRVPRFAHVLLGFVVPLGVLGVGQDAAPPGRPGAIFSLGAASEPLVILDEGGNLRGATTRVLAAELELSLGLRWGFEAVGVVEGNLASQEVDPGIVLPSEAPADGRLGLRFGVHGVAARALYAPATGAIDLVGEARHKLVGPVSLGAAVGLRTRAEQVIYGSTRGDAVAWLGGARIGLGAGLAASAELRGEVGLAGTASPVEWLAGLAWRRHSLGLTLLGGAGIGDEIGAPAWRMTLALGYHPPAPPRPPAPPPRPGPTEPTERDPDIVAFPALTDAEDAEDAESDDEGVISDADNPTVELVASEILLSESVFFETDRRRVRRRFRPQLNALARFLRVHVELRRVRIEGHADASGNPRWNAELAGMRATAVADFLVARGIKRARLVPVGHGEERPWADNATSTGRAQNRRVVFTVLEKSE